MTEKKRYLFITRADIVANEHLIELIWDGDTANGSLQTKGAFYAVPADHPNISVIALMLPDNEWQLLPWAEPTLTLI